MQARLELLIFTTAILAPLSAAAQPPNLLLYDLDTPLVSRSISPENATGEPGEGGKAESEIGVGRKGSPKHSVAPGETYVLCDIKGTGTIRHVWMTGEWRSGTTLRTMVIRAYWEGQEHPSIECPLGDFMGGAHSKVVAYQSAAHSVGQKGAFNFWFPMPFTSRARLTLTNEGPTACTVYHQVDYTLNDEHPADVGRLHTIFRRENPTTLKEDFVLMPKRTGKGRFLGAVIGVRTLHPGWWGEGEVKFYMDGDDEFPTICGTGSEDYVCLSYCVQQTTHQRHGCSLLQKSSEKFAQLNLETNQMVEAPRQYISMYRWHTLDPIYWKQECRVTIQQIGCCYYERDDDWSTASFWYEPVPSAPLEPMPEVGRRVADLNPLLKEE